MIKYLFFWIFAFFSIKSMSQDFQNQIVLESTFLQRKVWIDILLPASYFDSVQYYPVLWLNDGQDLAALDLKKSITTLCEYKKMQEILVVAIHNPYNRMQEYGVAGTPDYLNRGNKATEYTKFVLEELQKFIRSKYRCRMEAESNVFAGCSLGGLSAMDIVWNNPTVFGKVGVFSGSFWWRSKAFDATHPDDYRILQDKIALDSKKEGLKFWFQAGTQDETSDRNHNQIIDAIDDTWDVIEILETKGYKMPTDIRYVEVQEGKHDQATWAKIFPNFLEWAFKL